MTAGDSSHEDGSAGDLASQGMKTERRNRQRRSSGRGFSLPFPVLMALRYLKSTRRDAFTSFLSLVAAGAITVGVAALVVALAVLSGFQDTLRSDVLARTSPIEVELPPGLALEEAEVLRQDFTSIDGVTSAQLLVRGRGWLMEGGKVMAVEMIGFEDRVPSSFQGIGGRESGLYVGSVRAGAWGLGEGSVLDLVSPRQTLSPFGPQPRVRSLPLTGVYESGQVEDIERVAVPLAIADSLFGGERRRVLIGVDDYDGALEIADRLTASVPDGARVLTWQDLNRPLFFALRLERVLLFLGVSLIMVVAALALVADLSLIIASKRPEMGMLLAMGATPNQLRRTFLLLGSCLALVGAVLGTILGVGTSWILDSRQLVQLPSSVFFVDYVPFLVRGIDLALVLAVTIVLALFASLYATRQTVSLRPMEALKR